jgi:hypothetical protein
MLDRWQQRSVHRSWPVSVKKYQCERPLGGLPWRLRIRKNKIDWRVIEKMGGKQEEIKVEHRMTLYHWNITMMKKEMN